MRGRAGRACTPVRVTVGGLVVVFCLDFFILLAVLGVLVVTFRVRDLGLYLVVRALVVVVAPLLFEP